MHDSVREVCFFTFQIYLPNAECGEHLRGIQFQHIVPAGAHHKLRTQTGEFSASTKLSVTGTLLREMRSDGMLCLRPTFLNFFCSTSKLLPHCLRDACKSYSHWCVRTFSFPPPPLHWARLRALGVDSTWLQVK